MSPTLPLLESAAKIHLFYLHLMKKTIPIMYSILALSAKILSSTYLSLHRYIAKVFHAQVFQKLSVIQRTLLILVVLLERI